MASLITPRACHRNNSETRYALASIILNDYVVLQRWEITGIPSGWLWWIQRSRWIRWNRMWIERQMTVYPVQINRTIRGIRFTYRPRTTTFNLHDLDVHRPSIHSFFAFSITYDKYLVTHSITACEFHYWELITRNIINEEKKNKLMLLETIDIHCKI